MKIVQVARFLQKCCKSCEKDENQPKRALLAGVHEILSEGDFRIGVLLIEKLRGSHSTGCLLWMTPKEAVMSALLAFDIDGSPMRAVKDGEREAVTAQSDPTTDGEDGAVSRAREAVMGMRRSVAELAGVDLDELDGKIQLILSDELVNVLKKVTAIRADVLAAIEASGSWKGQGFRTLADRERTASGATKAESTRTITRAKSLKQDLPKFREEVHTGAVSMSHVDVVNRVANTPELRARLTDPMDGEAQLLDAAKGMDPDRFWKHAKAWAIKSQPTQCEEESRRMAREEDVTLVERDGGWTMRGWLTSENGRIVHRVLTAMMGVPSAADPRGPKERRAGALVGLCANAAEFGDIKKSALVAPHLSVHVPLETMLGTEMAARVSRERAEATRLGGAGAGGVDGATSVDGASEATDGTRAGRGSAFDPSADEQPDTLGRILATISSGYAPDLFEGLEPATFDDGTALLPSELQTLLCHSEMSRVLFGAKGEVLDVGRKNRFVRKSQIRAVVARDKTCRFPGCDITISSSEVHHAQHWEHDGRTDLNNLVMLCWFHHRHVHKQNITIVHHENGWIFKSRTGKILSRPPDAREHAAPNGAIALAGEAPALAKSQGTSMPKNGDPPDLSG